jgi:molecular chaperone GrpE
MRDPQVDENTQQANESDEPAEDTSGESIDETGESKTGSMEEELEAERQRSAEYLDQAQRARAEFVNYRRRTEEELARMQKQAGERIISKLLPAIDDLDRAIESMSDEERASSWGEGIVLVQRKIWSTLESEGVAPIEALGQPFDPSLHEAISMQEGANGATTVVQEYQRGFMLGDRVLRPAMVVVGSADDAPDDTDAKAETANAESNDERE